MKKFVLVVATVMAVLALSACSDVCVGPECYTDGNETTNLDNIINYTHVNGEGHEVERQAYILFEVETRDYVKYQVAFLSCTCRDKVVNYYNVMYLEINRYTQDVRTVSFTTDGENGHYTPGTWGDSSGDENQNYITFEMFQEDFFPWVEGKTYEDLAGIYVFDNDGHLGITNDVQIAEQDLIDEFAGSSVSTNNLIRVVKELLLYHAENYD